jgi:hypothetical protein
MARLFRLRRQRVFYLGRGDQIPLIRPKTALSLQLVGAENAEAVRPFRGEHYAGVFARYVKEGQTGVYAVVDGSVVGHAWARVACQGSERVRGYFDLFEGEALIHSCRVQKDQRGQRIYPSMLMTLCWRLFMLRRAPRVFIDTEIDNHASLGGIAKVGFHPYGVGYYLQFRNRLLFHHLQTVE